MYLYTRVKLTEEYEQKHSHISMSHEIMSCHKTFVLSEQNV